MEFSKQEYWSELPFPSPEGLPNPGIVLGSRRRGASPDCGLRSAAQGSTGQLRPGEALGRGLVLVRMLLAMRPRSGGAEAPVQVEERPRVGKAWQLHGR